MSEQQITEAKKITGSVVRVHDDHGRPTAFVGRVMLMQKRAFGVVCHVSGGQRRMVVPLSRLSAAHEDDMPQLVNVHKTRPADYISGADNDPLT